VTGRALTTDRVAGGALVLVGLIALWQSLGLPLGTLRNPGPAYMPAVLALLLVAFGVAVAAFGGASGRFADVAWSEWRHAVAIFATCAFAAWGMERLGYCLTMGVVLAFLLGILERKHPALTAVLVVAVAGGSFYLFNTVLRVPLPRGPFGF
jgi:hypothetical protein